MKKTKKIIIWLIVLIVIGFIGYLIFGKGEGKAEYVTEEVKKEDLKRIVSVTGTLEDQNKVDLGFEAGGKVIELKVKEGDIVKTGQFLGRVDGSLALSQLRQAQTDLATQEENLKLKRRIWNTLSPEEKETYKLAVDKAREGVVYYQGQLKKTALFSPKDGKVTKVGVRVGELVGVTDTDVISIIGEQEFKIECSIPETDVADVAVGQTADIQFDSLTKEEIFKGTVDYINSSSTVIQDVVYYDAKVVVKDLDSRLRDGMSADVDILTSEKKDVLTIPGRAVKKENGRSYVEILKTDGQVEKKDVAVGFKGDEGMVEISGLSVGEKVVLSVKNGK